MDKQIHVLMKVGAPPRGEKRIVDPRSLSYSCELPNMSVENLTFSTSTKAVCAFTH